MVSDRSIVERTNLENLGEITKRASEYGVDLILIGGNAVRAYTSRVSWRFTKDLDFITVSRDLGSLYGMFDELGYTVEETEFGLRGSKKINDGFSIELHISLDRVSDWSTGEVYELPGDIFDLAKPVHVIASLEGNEGLVINARVAPVEDIVIMKMMTGRARDHFDAVAIILDSYDDINLKRFNEICGSNDLRDIIRERITTLLREIRNRILARLWQENTGLVLSGARANDLRKKLLAIEKAIR